MNKFCAFYLVAVFFASCNHVVPKETEEHRNGRLFDLKMHLSDSVRHIRDSLMLKQIELQSAFLSSMYAKMDPKGDPKIHKELEATYSRLDREMFVVDSIFKDNKIYLQP
jgi:hypothetical protein